MFNQIPSGSNLAIKIMQWILTIFFLAITIMVLKCTCGSFSSSAPFESKISMELVEQCKVACNENDYEKAHKSLTKLLNEYEKYDDWDKATSTEHIVSVTEFVYKNEINYLSSHNREDFDQRLLYLLQEFPSFGSKISDDPNDKWKYNDWHNAFIRVCEQAKNIALMNNKTELASTIEVISRKE